MDSWVESETKKLNGTSDVMPNGCRLWTGGPSPEKCSYGKKRTLYPTIVGDHAPSQVVYVHRLAYMVSRKVVELPPSLEVSHRCHNPRCIKPQHLCLESHELNSERITCRLQGMCTQNHSPHCIFAPNE